MKRRRVVISIGGAAAVLLACGGCYERVIRSEGLAAPAGTTTYEPNLKQGDERSPLDVIGDALFGPVE